MWATGPGCVFPYLPDWLWRSQHPRKSRHRQKTEKKEKNKKKRKRKKETKLKNKPCKKNLLVLSRQKTARWLHFRHTLKGEKSPKACAAPPLSRKGQRLVTGDVSKHPSPQGGIREGRAMRGG